MYSSIRTNCFLNYIFIHSWTSGTCMHMGHMQGKLISLTHWPLIILPEALKIIAWCWRRVPSCTNPSSRDRKEVSGTEPPRQWSSSLKHSCHLKMPHGLIQTWICCICQGRDETVYWQKISFFTTATYFSSSSSLSVSISLWWELLPSYLSTTDMMPTLVLAPYKAFRNPLWSTQAWDEGRRSTWERKSLVGLNLPSAKPSWNFILW